MRLALFETNINKKAIAVHSDRNKHQYVFLIDGVEHRYSKKIGQEILLFLQKIISTEKVEKAEPIPADV